MTHDIGELLENKRLRETVVKTIQEVYSYAGTLHDNPSEDMEDVREEDLWEEAWWRAEIYGHIEKIDEAFDKYVFSEMRTPLTIYPDEILSEFSRLMCPGDIGCPEYEAMDFDNLYTAFVTSISLNVMSFRVSGSFPICIVSDNQEDSLLKGISAGLEGMEEVRRILIEELAKDDSAIPVLWQHTDLKICLAGKVPQGRRSDKRSQLSAYVIGRMSRKTLASMQSSLPEVLQTAIRSLSLLYSKEKSKVNAHGFIPYDGEKLHGYVHGLPVIREAVLHENKDTIRAFLDFYFDQMAKTRKRKKEKGRKDKSFERRIRNAVLLLIESDTQRNDAIGLALSMSAIEALLGEKRSDISERLSTNVAVLLEPDLEKRQAATEFVKDMYDKRSRALHGEQLDGESSYRLKARHLASAILCAIISGLNLLRRSGCKPQNPDGLLQNLRKSRFTKGQPFGVEEFNVREYWA